MKVISWKFFIPLATALALVAVLGTGLTFNMRVLPSALIGKPVPTFTLPPISGIRPGVSSADLKKGRVVLVNFFASWCVECRVEQPILMALSRKHVLPIYGIDYKDRPKDALAYLAELGDPYQRIGADESGRVSINWGLYGVPETYVITRNGHVAYKQIGPITQRGLERKIMPMVRKLQGR